jgi:hypothetical protein
LGEFTPDLAVSIEGSFSALRSSDEAVRGGPFVLVQHPTIWPLLLIPEATMSTQQNQELEGILLLARELTGFGM